MQAVEQHKKELHILHQQYQKLVDLKDHELEEYAYRVKTITAGKVKEMEELRTEHRQKIKDYETKIEDYQVSHICKTWMDVMLILYCRNVSSNSSNKLMSS